MAIAAQLLLHMLTATPLLASYKFCNPTTSPATTSRLCVYDPLWGSAIHPCNVCRSFSGNEYIEIAWRQDCLSLSLLQLNSSCPELSDWTVFIKSVTSKVLKEFSDKYLKKLLFPAVKIPRVSHNSHHHHSQLHCLAFCSEREVVTPGLGLMHCCCCQILMDFKFNPRNEFFLVPQGGKNIYGTLAHPKQKVRCLALHIHNYFFFF